MPVIQTLMLYGTKHTRESARTLLENQPDIHRVDFSGDQRLIRLHLDKRINETSLISMLEPSGISGFRLV